MKQIRLGTCLSFLLALVGLMEAIPAAPAQESASLPPPAEKAEKWDDARKKIEKLHATVTVNGAVQPLTIGEKPVLSFSDPIREINTGTVWLIGLEGRPQAILSLFFNDAENSWSYELTSLSTQQVMVEKQRRWKWNTKKSGLTVDRLSHKTTPAGSPTVRMTQMKAIARDFTAMENYQGSRIELRLLSQPLLRYADEKQGIVDGALFAFAHSTDPEVLLVIESIKGNDGTAGWRYGAARLSTAELHLLYQQAEVWTVDAVETFVVSDPYYSLQERPFPGQ